MPEESPLCVMPKTTAKPSVNPGSVCTRSARSNGATALLSRVLECCYNRLNRRLTGPDACAATWVAGLMRNSVMRVVAGLVRLCPKHCTARSEVITWLLAGTPPHAIRTPAQALQLVLRQHRGSARCMHRIDGVGPERKRGRRYEVLAHVFPHSWSSGSQLGYQWQSYPVRLSHGSSTAQLHRPDIPKVQLPSVIWIGYKADWTAVH